MEFYRYSYKYIYAGKVDRNKCHNERRAHKLFSHFFIIFYFCSCFLQTGM